MLGTGYRARYTAMIDKKLGHKGSLLISVIVAGVIGATVMYFLTQSLTFTQRASRATANSLEISNLQSLLIKLTSEQTICTSFVKDKEFLSEPTTLGAQKISGLSLVYPNTPTRKIAEANLELTPGVKVNEVSLENFVAVSANQYIADLTMRFKMPQGMGYTESLKKVSLSLNTLPIAGSSPSKNKIDSCRGIASGGGGGLDWDNPVFYEATQSDPIACKPATPCRPQLTTAKHKLCILTTDNHFGGRCTLLRNADGTWKLEGTSGDHSPYSAYWVQCWVYCYN